MGAVFRCVANLAVGANGACRAGTTFSLCVSPLDCVAPETCQIQYIRGEFSTRCAGAPKEQVGVGEHCNRHPEHGDLAYCETRLCLDGTCSGMCQSAADCPGGAMICSTGEALAAPAFPDVMFDVCMGQPCEHAAQCPQGYYCQVHFNGQHNKDAGWAHRCAAMPPGPVPILCQTDAQCAAHGASLRCAADSHPVHFNFGREPDKHLPLSFCEDYPGSQAACGSDAACAGDEACHFLAFLQPGGAIDGMGLCSSLPVDDHLCGTQTDCQESTYCAGEPHAQGFDETTLEDTVWRSWCRPAEGSRADCGADVGCGDGEACTAVPIAIGSTGPAKVEYVCLNSGFSENQAVCKTDGDCSSPQTCQNVILVDRLGDEQDVTAKLCKAK